METLAAGISYVDLKFRDIPRIIATAVIQGPAGVALGPDGALYFSSDSDINGLFRLKRMR